MSLFFSFFFVIFLHMMNEAQEKKRKCAAEWRQHQHEKTVLKAILGFLFFVVLRCTQPFSSYTLFSHLCQLFLHTFSIGRDENKIAKS